jgi:hypothetical protein
LKSKSKISTLVKPSVIGAKGFMYPDLEAAGYMISKGTDFDPVPYLGGGRPESLQAVLIENSKVTGSPVESGISLYWIKKEVIEN